MRKLLHRHQPRPIPRAIILAGVGSALGIAILAAITQFGSISLLIAPFGDLCFAVFCPFQPSFAADQCGGRPFCFSRCGFALPLYFAR